jgi:proline iminopeptidase
MKSQKHLILLMTILLLGRGAFCWAEVPVKEEKITAHDVTLFVRTVGDPAVAPVLIALNGGPGQSSHYMKSLERLAGPELVVVTFDQRGTGRSSEPKDGYALTKYAADIEAIRLHIKAEKVHLFGHSFGGVLVQAYAAAHPERVRSLILMGSGPPTAKDIAAAQARLGQRIQTLIKEGIISGPQPTTPDEILKYILPAYFSDPKFPIPEEILASSFRADIGPKTFADSGDWDFREEERSVTCPVLFLWGEDDPFGTEMADVSKNALRNADLTAVTLKKCGHYWHENMDDFFTHVEGFLKGNSFDPPLKPS